MSSKEKGLYIHIPFCDELCPYCAFSHVSIKVNKTHDYISRVIFDLDKIDDSISSIYIGGGTPSSLSIFELDRLLSSLDRFINDNTSFAIEVNPSSLDKEKIKLFKKHHVNRISLGIQTFNKSLQEIIKRYHSFEEIKEKINWIREENILDINVDLMYGLPNETLSDLNHDLDLFLDLMITHISCYCLQVEEHTLFYNQKIKEMNEDDASLEYELICKRLKERGFIHYEVSNFCLPNKESKHNLLYWRNKEYIGIGISSAGYENNIRYTNKNSLSSYIRGEAKRSEETLTKLDEEEYYIILNLRLKDGIDLEEYQNLYKKDFFKEYKDVVYKLIENKDLIYENNHLYVLEDKWFILNRILINFIRVDI